MYIPDKTSALDRRQFLGAALGAGALAASGLGLGGCAGSRATAEEAAVSTIVRPVEAKVDPKTGEVTVNEDVWVRYSACLGCYSSCGNRVSIDRATGRVLGVGGNPYNPNNAYPYLDHTEPLTEAYRSMSCAPNGQDVRGTLCGRGNGTWDAYRQPGRITVPLKRAGARGEGKWVPISWDQLIEEVVEGGRLFADLGEDREVEGFRALFDTKTPLDPDAPELGPVANQMVMFGSRGDGRSNVGSRFSGSFGTKNNIGHGATCGGSENAGFYAVESSGYRALCADFTESEYVISCGMFPGANGKCMQGIAHWASGALDAGTLKLDIVDPALGNGVATPAMGNVAWHPINTATDAAFGMGLMRCILDDGSYNAEALAFPTWEAALAGGYGAYTNACYLVVDDPSSESDRRLLRAAEAGLEVPPPVDEKDETVHYAVIDQATGAPALHTACAQGDLDFEGEVNGIHVRTAFQAWRASVEGRTVEEYAEICGVPADEIRRMAREFTSHGTKAGFAGLFGGTAQVNGSAASFVYSIMNALIGSNNMRGGMVPRREGGDALGDKTRYRLSTVKGRPKASGVSIARTGFAWEDTSEYQRRKAAGEADPKPLLPWYPATGSADNQAICSVANAYPYQAKLTLTWMATPLQASSGALREEIIEKLKDPAVVPLAITCDVFMGESASLSDYFVPDTTPYESWGVRTQEGYWNGKGNTVRWQAVKPATLELGDGRYACYETFLCDVAERLEMAGFGADAIEAADGTPYPFTDAHDYFLKAVANLAYSGDDPVPDIDPEEARLQGLDQLPAQWRRSVSEEEWPKVLQVLSRGGRFWPLEGTYDERGRTKYAASYMACFYNEDKATATNPYTGEYESGVLCWSPETCADRTPLRELYPADEWPFASTNYKPKFRSISMLSNSPVMQQISAANYIEMNADDATGLGIANGDWVDVENPTGDVMHARALVRGGIATGTFAVAYGYGHLAYGAQPVTIGDEERPGDQAVAAGVHLQTMLDPRVEGILPISDPEAATPGRSGGVYRIRKA